MDEACDVSEGMILVMGATGAGKSYFINQLKKGCVTVGHSLSSETVGCEAVRILLDEEDKTSIIVVDTPGFDDSDRQDGEIFSEITEFLAGQYALRIPLKGILYLHKIVDNRMTGSSQRYLDMVRTICGDQALKNVVLVTTMWNKIRDEDQGEVLQREQELIDKYWLPMMELGSSVSQFTGSSESAFALVWDFVGRESIVLDIQTQLVDEDMHVSQTTAGQPLFEKLLYDESQYTEHARELESKIVNCAKTGDKEGQKKALEQKAEVEKVLRQIRRSQSRMGIRTGRKIMERIRDRMSGKVVATSVTVFTTVLSITLTLVKFLAV